MPLKLVPPRAGKSKNWSIRGTYLGQYIDRSTGAGKRAVALKILKDTERDIESGRLSRRDEPTFASAAAAYVKAGGEWKHIRRLLEHFGETPLSEIDQAAIDTAAAVLYPGGTGATRNRCVYTPVCAICRRAGCRLDLRRPQGAAGNRATAWLWPEQAFALIEAAEKLDPAFAALLTVLLYTGLRLSEALGLTWDHIRLNEGFAYVPTTKNEQPRAVFLPPVAVAAMGNLERGGRPFRFVLGRHLYQLLKTAAANAGIELPRQSAFHILRHTWATWMRRYAGLDTKGLVATGAWKDRKSADRYEHIEVSEEAAKAAMLPTRKVG